jgi:multiple sugar transport system ATP-binding protein
MANLTINNVSKAYGANRILNDISLDIADGEFLTLLGPSGCGTSTLLRIIAGLEQQDSGTIAIDGELVDDLAPKRRDIAMVFQSYALYPHMSVARNIAVPMEMRHLNVWQRLPLFGRLVPSTRSIRRTIRMEVDRVAKSIEIDHLLNRKPGQLSGGQRQRVAVGRAIIRQPRVFLMDEPLSNLDAKLRVQMRAEIKDLHRRLGITFIYVTHDQSEAMTLSDRVAVMHKGSLLQIAPPSVIYSTPANRQVAEFIGTQKLNLMAGHVRDDGWVQLGGALLETNCGVPGQHVAVGIRPEAFHLADQGGPGKISGIVRLTEHTGSDIYVHIDVSGTSDVAIARLAEDRAPFIKNGDTVHLCVKPNKLLLFDGDDGRLISREPKVARLRDVAHA